MPIADISPDGLIVVHTQWHDKELIKQIPGKRYDPFIRAWTLPLSWSACMQLRGIFRETLEIGDELRKWAWADRTQRIEPALTLRQQTEPIDPSVDLEGLYPFQYIGREFLDVAGDALLGDDMGTGKTIQLLTALRQQALLPALVICPNGPKRAWAREAAHWFPEAFPVVIGGGPAAKKKLFTGPALRDDALVIINIEAVRLHSRLTGYGSIRLVRCRECDKTHGEPSLPSSRCEVHTKELNRIHFKAVILDEAHRIKEPGSKQTRAVWAVGHMESVQRRWAATGTPIANAPDDLWPIMHFVAPYEYPTKSNYVDRYCLMSWNNQGGTDVVGINPERRDEFFSILDPRFRRMSKELVLDQLPKKVYTTRTVPMSPKQKKAYDEMSKQLITVLDDGTLLVAPNDMVAQTRLLQLASSYCKVESYDPRQFDDHGREKLRVTMLDSPPSPKLDELEQVLDELGIFSKNNTRQVAVSSEHRQILMLAIDRLKKRGVPVSVIVGGLTDADREHAEMSFQHGKTRVMLFTLKAGGTGMTFTAADTIIRLQRSWSMIDNKQGEDRVHRIGSERHESIGVIDLVTEDTVEDKVQLPRLLEKLHRLEEIVRDRATLIAKGMTTIDLDNEEARILALNLGMAR